MRHVGALILLPELKRNTPSLFSVLNAQKQPFDAAGGGGGEVAGGGGEVAGGGGGDAWAGASVGAGCAGQLGAGWVPGIAGEPGVAF